MTNSDEFYWQTARDSLLTPAALNMFQIALAHDGEDFEEAKDKIDREYETARGLSKTERHGGNFQTYIRAFEEAGWISLINSGWGETIQVTPAGRQAELLLTVVPDFLKAVPFFLLELLSKYQLNNPSGPKTVKNKAIKEQTRESNIFPYYTIWKIMRKCDNFITSDELRRFVFRLHKTEEIDDTIKQIREFRDAKDRGVSQDEIDAKFPPPIDGAVGETKYIMQRAGTYIGKHPPLIIKPDRSTFQLNVVYLPLLDQVLDNEQIYKDYLDEETWFKDYGSPVAIEEEYVPFSISETSSDSKLTYEPIDDNDPVWQQVKELIDLGVRNILFVGPPGTSKTTYALSIGAKLAEGDAKRFHNIQLHQSYGYEDFIEGYVPGDSSKDQASFLLKDKVLLRASAAAHRDTDKKFHVLVIDEINRGDPSRIFGEAMTFIERRDERFELPYSGRAVLVPSNLVILATMNPFDKSISDLDQAMDRRFEKVMMNPSVNILRELLQKKGADPGLIGQVLGFFHELNKEIENRVGHAYFKDVRDTASLNAVWRHRVLPLLKKELRFADDKLQKLAKAFDTTFNTVKVDSHEDRGAAS